MLEQELDRASVRLIGLALLDFDTVQECVASSGFSPKWLDGDWCKAAWRVISDMTTRGLPIDPAFASEHAKTMGITISSVQFRNAEKQAPSRRNGADGLIELIRKEFIGREVVHYSEVLSDPGPNPEKTAGEVAQSLLQIVAREEGESMAQAAEEVCAMWQEAHEGKIHGLPMPWPTIFGQTGGVTPGQVCLYVGFGNSGKSASVLQWARYAANNGWPSLVFPFEDGNRIAIARLACMDAQESAFRLRLGKSTDLELERAQRAARGLLDHSVYLHGRSCGMDEVFAVAQHHVVHKGVKAVFLDAFKDIKGMKDNRGQDETIGEIKEMAGRLDVPVVLTHHIRKQSTAMKSEPGLVNKIMRDDIKGSGGFWDNPRMVMALQAYPTVQKDSFGNIQYDLELEVLKSNNGVSGMKQKVIREKTLELMEAREKDENALDMGR